MRSPASPTPHTTLHRLRHRCSRVATLGSFIPLLSPLALAPGALLGSQAALAQSDDRVFEELIVTARKRSESMFEVPVSINVVSESTIENLGAQDYTDLLGSVPSLTAYQNGPGRTRISIRGVANGGGNDNDTQNQETVGIYLDEIPISMGAMNPELSLFDLERVEVLRGPQGTLFGAGSMTGTIRLVSKKPDLNEWGGKVETSFASVSQGEENSSIKGLLNAPVVEDKLGIRTSLYYIDKGGYIDNVTTGKRDINDATSKGGRISSRWQASDLLTVDFSAFYHDYTDGGRPEDLDRTREFARDYPSFDGYDDEMEIYNLTLRYDLQWAELVSSTSYFDRTVVNRRSLDTLFEVSLPPGIVPHELVDTTDTETYVQEFRLASTTDHDLQWILGAYADKRDVFYENTFPVPGADAVLGIDSNDLGAPTDFLFFGFDDLVVETFAFFGEVYYTIDKFTLTAGLRYFDWKQDIEFYQSGLFNGGFNSDERPEGNIDDVNPKVNLSYDISDNALIYVQAAKGFRYGGINGAIPEAVCADELEEVTRSGGDVRFFEPDEIWNYEIGTKGSAVDGRLLFNMTYFHIDWSDMQTSRSFECGFGFKENVGEATSKGVELEFTARPIDSLTVSLGGSYIDTTLSEDVPNLNAEKGDAAPYVPKLLLNGSVEYARPITDSLTGFVWANIQYTDDRATEFNSNAPNYREMDAYKVSNLRLGVQTEHYEVSLFVNNLSDNRGVVRALRRPPFDPDATIRVHPRTIGITLRGDF